MKENTVSTNFLVTKSDLDDYVDARFHIRYKFPYMWPIRIAILILIMVQVLSIIFMSSSLSYQFVTAIYIGMLVFLYFFVEAVLPILAKRALIARIAAGKCCSQQITFTKTNVQIVSEDYSADLPYAMLYGAYENKKVILLQLGEEEIKLIPKRALINDEEKQITGLLESQLKEKFKREGV